MLNSVSFAVVDVKVAISLVAFLDAHVEVEVYRNCFLMMLL